MAEAPELGRRETRCCLLVPRADVKARGDWLLPPGVVDSRWSVGVVVGSGGVSANALAYFGTRPGLVPGRRHDV
jgi:hypothetical protein